MRPLRPRIGLARSITMVVCAFVLAACADRTPLGPGNPPDDGPETIRLLPHSLTLPVGDRYIFEVLFSEAPVQALTWSVTGGTIAAEGARATYTAPALPGTYTVTARGAADPKVRGSATIVVAAMPSVLETGPSGPELIDGAIASGTLDISTGTLYKAYWAFGDPRLPGQFAASGGWAAHAPREIIAPPDGVSEAARSQLGRYTLPPDHPDSWYQLQWREENGLAAGAARSSAPTGARPALEAATVAAQQIPEHPDLARRLEYAAAPSGKLRVAWDPRYPGDEARARALAIEMDVVRNTYVSSLGVEPISPAGPGAPYDVYLVALASEPVSVTISRDIAALSAEQQFVGPCPPFSSFVLINRNYVGARLRATFAHELLHAFHFALGAAGGCFAYNWLHEATGAWAETFFFPDGDQRDSVLRHFFEDHHFPMHLWDGGRPGVATQGYSAYPFFTFLERRYSPAMVFGTLRSMQTESTPYRAIDAGAEGFGQKFKEFALAAWGEAPYTELAGWLKDSRRLVRHGMNGVTDRAEPLELGDRTHATWSPSEGWAGSGASFVYYWLSAGSEKPPAKIRINNPLHGATLEGPADSVGVQLLYRKAGQGVWSHEDLSGSDGKTFCRDRQEENYDEFALVISNGIARPLPGFARPVAEGWSECDYEIRLQPVTVVVRPGEAALFQVTVDPEYQGTLSYVFTTRAVLGFLLPGMLPSIAPGDIGPFAVAGAASVAAAATCPLPGPGGGLPCLTTASPSVTYRANANAPDGVETIDVEVFDENGESLGTATATVEVRQQYTVTIEPGDVEIFEGGSASFQAQLDPPYVGAGLSYRWTSPGTHGSLSPPSGSVTGNAGATYTARSGAQGTDQIFVEVFGPGMRSLGSASASVTVQEKEDMVVHGSADIQLETYMEGNNERYCLAVFVTFPLVAGATQYEMYAYNFDDPFFWGTEIHRTLKPPFPQYVRCNGTGSVGVSGADGTSAYYLFLGSGSGPASGAAAAEAFTRPRFETMKVDVTVRF